MKKHFFVLMVFFLLFSFSSINVLAFNTGSADSIPSYENTMNIQVSQIEATAKSGLFPKPPKFKKPKKNE